MPEEAEGKTGVPTPSRNKPERPRDELGRPQPWGSPGRLQMEDFDSLTLEENHELGVAHLEAGRYFSAHEAWETAWKKARGTGDEELFKGLSQMGAGYVHLLRGNAHGAITLLRRAAGRIASYPDGHRRLPTQALAGRLRADADRVESGDLVPGESATVAPLTV